MRVGVISCNMGNISSVCNAIQYLGYDPVQLHNPQALANVDRVILPGVGAFQEGMARLQAAGWVDAMKDACKTASMPLLGICLGMQLLADDSEEFGYTQGLGLIHGHVKKLRFDNEAYRLPHIGWNTVSIKKQDSILYRGMESENDMYFIHSYCFWPEDAHAVSATCNYGVDFVASVEQGNVFGAQFHPEKSHKKGLQILRNFIENGGN